MFLINLKATLKHEGISLWSAKSHNAPQPYVCGLQDDRLSPPKKIVVKMFFFCVIKFLCPCVIVFEGFVGFK